VEPSINQPTRCNGKPRREAPGSPVKGVFLSWFAKIGFLWGRVFAGATLYACPGWEEGAKRSLSPTQLYSPLAPDLAVGVIRAAEKGHPLDEDDRRK